MTNEVAAVAAVEEETKEEEEIGDLSSVLEMLGLSEYLSIFETEKIDVESLVRIYFCSFFFLYKEKHIIYENIPALLFPSLCSSCAR